MPEETVTQAPPQATQQPAAASAPTIEGTDFSDEGQFNALVAAAMAAGGGAEDKAPEVASAAPPAAAATTTEPPPEAAKSEHAPEDVALWKQHFEQFEERRQSLLSTAEKARDVYAKAVEEKQRAEGMLAHNAEFLQRAEALVQQAMHDPDSFIEAVQRFKETGQPMQFASQGAAPANGQGGLAGKQLEDFVQKAVEKALGQRFRQQVVQGAEHFAAEAIDAYPVLKANKKQARLDLIDRLNDDARSGRITDGTPVWQLANIAKKHAATIAAEQERTLAPIIKGLVEKHLAAKNGLPPHSKTPGTATPTKPASLEVDYGATDPEGLRRFDEESRRVFEQIEALEQRTGG